MSIGRPWTVKFKETSITVVSSILGFLLNLLKGLFSAFTGGFGR